MNLLKDAQLVEGVEGAHRQGEPLSGIASAQKPVLLRRGSHTATLSRRSRPAALLDTGKSYTESDDLARQHRENKRTGAQCGSAAYTYAVFGELGELLELLRLCPGQVRVAQDALIGSRGWRGLRHRLRPGLLNHLGSAGTQVVFRRAPVAAAASTALARHVLKQLTCPPPGPQCNLGGS